MRSEETLGAVTDGVLTASGELIGVGDKIATRRNDHDVDVANRETWTVLARQQGALIVLGETGRRVLPPGYVREHVELAYATTAYGAQGSTVPVSHVLVGDHTVADLRRFIREQRLASQPVIRGPKAV